MRFDFFKLSVLGDFSGATAYLDIIERAIPEAEAREAEALREKAESEGWEYEDYECARQGHEGVFEYSVPEVLSFSFLTYVHAMVEVRLGDVASALGEDRGFAIKHSEFRGSAISQVHLYLTKIAQIPIGTDPGWQRLRDLATLRNAIVHRGGRLGSDARKRKELREIARRLPLGLTASDGWDKESSELKVTFDLCRFFAKEAYAFFERLLALTRAETRGLDVQLS